MENTTRHRHNAEANPDQIQVCEDGDVQSENSSIDESEIDFVPDANHELDIIRTKTFMYVSDLARKSNKSLAKKSSLYNWNLMTIAIFYGLPGKIFDDYSLRYLLQDSDFVYVLECFKIRKLISSKSLIKLFR